MKIYSKIFFLIILGFSTNSCINPFAPKLNEDLGSEGSLISDLSSIEGVFKNLQYAYTFKDTTIYGDLLDKAFTFTYRDYDREIDVAWGREDEMRVTYGLFNNSERLDLIWNNIVAITSDSSNVVRSFNLTITFNPTDVIFIDGKVNLQLEKSIETEKWQILTWIDESNF
ncbi:MAG: hypothetical protein H6610_10835 [Ignavibacteriales bacterium]|nr:hypothetical protein [Ignavibacteriales bacterium]MCB9210564.1 hypothetical protein [Ignavibacteriales bacterium]MCB9219939.1 hypothetical protein [Ignavibacteriales bacterium]